MAEDFTTIEHDFLHTKDYFNNYKFTYKERKSKLDFFQNISNSSVQDTAALMEVAKTQLVEVKQQYRDMDAEIKALSQEVHAVELRVAQKMEMLSQLKAEEDALGRECENFKVLDEKLRINTGLNSELDAIESEIKRHYAWMDEYRSALVSYGLDEKRAEERELRACRQELAAKQKRLTVINTDSYIEDIYCWHQQLRSLLECIFGTLTVEAVDSRVVFRMALANAQIEVTICDRKMVNAFISGNPSEEAVARFNESKEFCIRTNNMLLLLSRTLFPSV